MVVQNTLENLLPVSPWKHDEIDPYRHFKPLGGKNESNFQLLFQRTLIPL